MRWYGYIGGVLWVGFGLLQTGCASFGRSSHRKVCVDSAPAYSRSARLGDGDELAQEYLRTRPRRPEHLLTYESYVAVRGDSYWLIAKRFNISLEDLLNANGATKTDILRIGQEVQIPVRKSVSVSFTNHVVRRGETLSSIAREYSTSVAELRGANELPDDQLRVGQQIVIPVGNAVTVGSLATSQKSAAGHETCEYVVRRGDTLSRIAAENGMSTKELIALNGIKEPNHIREGQRLIVRNNPAQQASTVELPKKAAGTAQINSKQPAAKRFDDDLLGLFDDGELFNVSN